MKRVVASAVKRVLKESLYEEDPMIMHAGKRNKLNKDGSLENDEWLDF